MRELDARANQLAHHLRALGVGPEIVVGLCVERSLEMLVGLLGILKAGGAYLPLDPDYPRERLAFMLADAARAGAGHASGAARSAARARRPCRAPRCRLARRSRAQPATAPAIVLDPQHPAYVIYTSGSTGTPKGVAVTHRGIPNLGGSCRSTASRSRSDARVLQFASSSFDAAISEFCDRLIIGRAPRPAATGAQRRCLARLIRDAGRHRMRPSPPALLADLLRGPAARRR